jgi:DNA-binding LacI/PurR family transcriptional regulator
MSRTIFRVAVTTHPEPDLSSPYFSACFTGLKAVFNETDLFVNPQDPFVDGWILLAPDAGQLLRVRKEGKPAVIVNGAGEGFPSIDLDNVGGACAVTVHLAEQGHRRIGFIAGKSETSNARDRHRRVSAGFRTAWNSLGSGARDRGAFCAGRGEKRHDSISYVALSFPTAVFAANDPMALGAWDVLKEKNIPVPRAMALAGFDDVPEAEAAGLTSVRQPLAAMTRQAGGWLLDWIRSGRPPERGASGRYGGEPIFAVHRARKNELFDTFKRCWNTLVL